MGPTAFRDGIFSATDPMSRYGRLMTSYSDGSLGVAATRVGECQRLCSEVNMRRNTPGRIRPCNKMCRRFPKRWTARLMGQMQQDAARRTKKQSTSGLGELDSTTMTATAIGVALVGGLLWLGSSKKRRR